jgi:hypothetical protein
MSAKKTVPVKTVPEKKAAAPLSRAKAPSAAQKAVPTKAKAAAPVAPVTPVAAPAPAKKAKPAPYVAPQADVDANAAAVPEANAVPEPPKTKKVKAPKEPKAPKIPRESRTGMIVDMLLAQASTDDDIYEAVKAKFGDFAKNQISICRCDLNDTKHPKYKAKKEAAGFDNTKTRIVQLIPAEPEVLPTTPSVA